jgi:hypothetical protein
VVVDDVVLSCCAATLGTTNRWAVAEESVEQAESPNANSAEAPAIRTLRFIFCYPFSYQVDGLLPVVSTAPELVALLTGGELADVVGRDVGEPDFEFCCELAGIPEDVSEFFDDVGLDGLVVTVSVELLPLVGDFSGFSDEAEDAVVDGADGVVTGFWVDSCGSGVFLVVVKGISAGICFG